MKGVLGEAPLHGSILLVMQASLRAVAHVRDAQDMRRDETLVQGCQVALHSAIGSHNRSYSELWVERELGNSKQGKHAAGAHHELLRVPTLAPQLEEVGVHTTEDRLSTVNDCTMISVVTNVYLRQRAGIGAGWGLCPSPPAVGSCSMNSPSTAKSYGTT